MYCINILFLSRKLTYPNTDIFLVCYSTVDKVTFDNVRNKWLPELRAHQPNALKMLVGTMADKRSEKGGTLGRGPSTRTKPVTREQAERLRKEYNMVDSMECSALVGETSVNPVFQKAAETVINGPDDSVEHGGCATCVS